MTTKEYNATLNGQKEMARNALNVSTVLMLNSAIKRKGGIGWEQSFIESANDVLLVSIRDDLTREWNELCGKSQPNQ